MRNDLAKYPWLAELWSYWLQKRRGRAMPHPADIVPYEIPKLLSYLSMVDRDGMRFRYRLMGTAVSHAYGFEGTGKYFDEVLSGRRLAAAIKHCEEVWEEAQPILAATTYSNASGLVYGTRRVLLPLSDDGQSVSKILIGNAMGLDLVGTVSTAEHTTDLTDDHFVVLDEEQYHAPCAHMDSNRPTDP